jgi:hypothetical protein
MTTETNTTATATETNATTLAVQNAVKTFIADGTSKSDAILTAVQAHLKIEDNQGPDQFKTLLDAIGTAGKEAAKFYNAGDKIPSSIKQMSTAIRSVYNEEKFGVPALLNADCMYKVRQAYSSICEARKAAKEADKTDKADAKEDTAETAAVFNTFLSISLGKLQVTQNLINKEGSRVLQNELTAQIEALVETFNSRLGNELTDAKRKQDATIAAMETEKADAKIEAAMQGPKNIKRNRKASNKSATSVGKLNGVSVAAMKPNATTATTATVN